MTDIPVIDLHHIVIGVLCVGVLSSASSRRDGGH